MGGGEIPQEKKSIEEMSTDFSKMSYFVLEKWQKS